MDPDAQSILERRALLVSSLLTALGCAPAAAPDGVTSGAPSTTTLVDVPSAPAASASAAIPPVGDPGPATAWSALMDEVPPLDVSSKLGAAEADQRRKVTEAASKLHAALRALYESPPPSCDLREEECKPKWLAAASELLRIEDAVPKARNFGLCGYAPDDLLDETIELEAQHETFLRALIGKVRASLDARAAKTGVLSEQVWLKHSVRPRPGVGMMPCLSCVAPSSFRFGAGIAFGEGQGALDDASRAKVGELASILKTNKAAVITVRGHADPQEPDADKLALARATAIRSELVSQGVDQARVKIAAMGAELPIASSKTPEGRDENRKAWVGAIRYQ